MSSEKRIYIMDSSSLITPYRNYYAPSIAPTFWHQLEGFINQGIVATIDKVRDEILRIDDGLRDWFNRTFRPSRPIPFSKKQPNDSLFAFQELQTYAQIIAWADGNDHFKKAAKEEFKKTEIADAFLVAFCKAHSLILVTEEKYDPNTRKKIPLPNVCRAFNVPYIGLFDMMRELGIKL